jgi:hypothetical protein
MFVARYDISQAETGRGGGNDEQETFTVRREAEQYVLQGCLECIRYSMYPDQLEYISLEDAKALDMTNLLNKSCTKWNDGINFQDAVDLTERICRGLWDIEWSIEEEEADEDSV